MLTQYQAYKKIKESFPKYDILSSIDYDSDFYLFSMNDQKLIDFRKVNKHTGSISGYVSLMELIEDPKFVSKMPNATTYEKGYLQHSGVKGMKWGVQNGPPYPLTPDRQTRNRIVGMSPETADIIRDGVSYLKTLSMLTPIGWAVVAKDAFDIGKQVVKNQGQKQVQTDFDAEGHILQQKKNASKLHMIQGQHTKDQDMKAVNPNYGKAGTTNNCVLCTTAYDMRRRGYDVKAQKALSGFDPEKWLSKWYKDPKIQRIKNSKSWKDASNKLLTMYPDGSRGNLCMWFNSNITFGGHSVVWQREGNDIIIRDCQTGKSRKMSKMSDIQWASWSFQVVRTDNLDINLDEIAFAVSSN